MLNQIKENVLSYREYYNALELNAKSIRQKLLNSEFNCFIEEKQIIELKPLNIDFSAVASDSGFFNDSLTGLDFVYVKSAGAYFKYNSGKLTEYLRLPKKPNKNLYFSEYILQKDEIHKFVSIKRIIQELEVLKKSAVDKNPDFLLIDGPVLPQPVDRPLNNSKLYNNYKTMITKFVELYDLCKKQDTHLIGCVEDSRATTFIDLIKEPITRLNDTLLLDLILKKSESTSFFEIFSQENNIIKQDLKEFGDFKFHASYLKFDQDYPLRIETPSIKFDKVRNVIDFLSNNFKDYSYPAPLIDADKQAKLSKNEIETIRHMIESEFSKMKIRKMRRNRRI